MRPFSADERGSMLMLLSVDVVQMSLRYNPSIQAFLISICANFPFHQLLQFYPSIKCT